MGLQKHIKANGGCKICGSSKPRPRERAYADRGKEFKKRLLELIGNAANYIDIKTFHSFCFDLLGRIGSLSGAPDIVKRAASQIRSGELDAAKVTRAVLVIDEAQDMNQEEFDLVQSIMERNEEMRVILVGDDEQNIYEFRGTSSAYMQQFITEKGAVKYELIENYRSKRTIVAFANSWAAKITQRLKDDPGVGIPTEPGTVQITSYQHPNMLVPLANVIAATPLAGTTCILTRNNEEAMLLAGVLLQKGMRAKLIQSNDGFDLNNLYELRYFYNALNSEAETPLISDDDWARANQQLNTLLVSSDKKDLVNAIIRSFEDTNTSRKYKSDWRSFLSESKIEDFSRINSDIIYVSTIHKAKGKEFENVFLLLNNFKPDNDAVKRQVYVAITRPKSNLSIHYNGRYLQASSSEEVNYIDDSNAYPEPDQIALFLTHKDVWLGYFEFKQQRIEQLYSGAPLQILEDGLANAKGEQVIKFSRQFCDSLAIYKAKGFSITQARVNFLVYWKHEEKGKEWVVVLARVILRK